MRKIAQEDLDYIFGHDFGDDEITITIHPWLWARWMQIPYFVAKFQRLLSESNPTLLGKYGNVIIYLNPGISQALGGER